MNTTKKTILHVCFSICMVLLVSLTTQTVQAQVKQSVGNRKSTERNKQNRNKRGADKKTNINSNNKNVNINIDNSKNVKINNNRYGSVRRPGQPNYSRPPYRYGGRRYYSYHPYHYRPYRPYSWGPAWHPWGFFIRTLAVTAIIISIENQHYHYDQGIYYIASNDGYTVVQAPVGATVTVLPAKTDTVVVTQTVNNYYFGGTFYEKTDKGYTVVAPTAGVTVENLPEGGKEIKIGDKTYVQIGDTYYQPVELNGKSLYEVVDVLDDK